MYELPNIDHNGGIKGGGGEIVKSKSENVAREGGKDDGNCK